MRNRNQVNNNRPYQPALEAGINSYFNKLNEFYNRFVSADTEESKADFKKSLSQWITQAAYYCKKESPLYFCYYLSEIERNISPKFLSDDSVQPFNNNKREFFSLVTKHIGNRYEESVGTECLNAEMLDDLESVFAPLIAAHRYVIAYTPPKELLRRDILIGKGYSDRLTGVIDESYRQVLLSEEFAETVKKIIDSAIAEDRAESFESVTEPNFQVLVAKVEGIYAKLSSAGLKYVSPETKLSMLKKTFDVLTGFLIKNQAYFAKLLSESLSSVYTSLERMKNAGVPLNRRPGESAERLNARAVDNRFAQIRAETEEGTRAHYVFGGNLANTEAVQLRLRSLLAPLLKVGDGSPLSALTLDSFAMIKQILGSLPMYKNEITGESPVLNARLGLWYGLVAQFFATPSLRLDQAVKGSEWEDENGVMHRDRDTHVQVAKDMRDNFFGPGSLFESTETEVLSYSTVKALDAALKLNQHVYLINRLEQKLNCINDEADRSFQKSDRIFNVLLFFIWPLVRFVHNQVMRARRAVVSDQVNTLKDLCSATGKVSAKEYKDAKEGVKQGFSRIGFFGFDRRRAIDALEPIFEKPVSVANAA